MDSTNIVELWEEMNRIIIDTTAIQRVEHNNRECETRVRVEFPLSFLVSFDT